MYVRVGSSVSATRRVERTRGGVLVYPGGYTVNKQTEGGRGPSLPGINMVAERF